MNETPYQPKPYKDRPSQNIKPKGYMKYVGIVLLPIITNIIGYQIGKRVPSGRKQISFEDENSTQPSMFHQYGDFLKNLLGESTHQGRIYGAWGAKIGVAVSAFLLWQQKEKKHLEVADTVNSVKDIAHLHQTNEDLERDNKIVKRLIEYQREKQQSFGERAAASSNQESSSLVR